METTDSFTPEDLLDAGRRTIERKALQKTIRDMFSYRNPLRQFMEGYRFNVIRWRAANLKEPSIWKRAALFFNTRGLPGILRDNFRQNRADLLTRWERNVINDINRSLIRLGGIPLSSKPRDLSRQLKDISRKIYRMTTSDRCPSLLQESLLLSTYEYIFASPHERKFGNLCPDEICGMLRQNGDPQESLCYQNYGSILAGRETVLYEFTSDGKATLYLKPMDHVRLEMTSKGYDMVPAGLPPARTVPSPTESVENQPRLSEKIGKIRKPRSGKKPAKEAGKAKKGHGTGQPIKNRQQTTIKM